MRAYWPALLAAAAVVSIPAVARAQDTDSLRATVARLAAKVDSLEARLDSAAAVPTQAADTTDELAALRAAAGGAARGDSVSPAVPPGAAPAGPRGANLLNPEISATGDVRFVARDESPQENNAVAREFEFAFQSALDPYSSTKVFLTVADEELGIEEGYIYWTGLPGGIRADVGKFRQQIGDLNRWHLHGLPETEYPLVYQRFLGEEGLS